MAAGEEEGSAREPPPAFPPPSMVVDAVAARSIYPVWTSATEASQGGEPASSETSPAVCLPFPSLSSGYIRGYQSTVGILPETQVSLDGLKTTTLTNHMVQDDHEQKRQKRKLSNRESARRSRERKQKECEDLAREVDDLNTQNNDLRAEIDKLNMECKSMEAENASIAEELKHVFGSDALTAIAEEKFTTSALRILGVECDGHTPEGSNLVPLVYQSTGVLPTPSSQAQ